MFLSRRRLQLRINTSRSHRSNAPDIRIVEVLGVPTSTNITVAETFKRTETNSDLNAKDAPLTYSVKLESTAILEINNIR